MRPMRWLRRGMLLAGAGAAGTALFVTARHLLMTPQPLKSALPGEGRIDRKHGGDIYYNVAGADSAESLVLLHDFYPGASNYEYRHIFPRLAPSWRVYAPDWLGFGMSEHPPLAYTGEFYANMLLGFLRDVVGRPAIVVGHGLAANIAVRAAADAPSLFSRLVIISPNVEAGIELEPKASQVLARASQRVSLGLVPYAFLSTKPLLRRLAQGRSALTGETSAGEDTVEHLYASAHQFGGQHALLALLTGELDLPIQNVFPLLEPPVLLISGDEDPTHPVDAMEELAILNPHADLDVLASAGDAVFEDQPALFTEALTDWLASASARQQPQVEEYQPVFQEAAIPAPTEPLPDVVALPETALPETSAIENAPEAPDTNLLSASSETRSTPEGTSDMPDTSGASAATNTAPRTTKRTSSRPATRATSQSVSAPANQPRATRAPETPSDAPAKRTTTRKPLKPGQNATKRASSGASGTSGAKKSGSRGAGAKKTDEASSETTSQTTRGTSGRSRSSQNSE